MPSVVENADDSETEFSKPRWDNHGLTKVTSSSEYEGISPLMLAKNKEVDDFDLDSKSTRTLSRSYSSRKKGSLTSSPNLHTLTSSLRRQKSSIPQDLDALTDTEGRSRRRRSHRRKHLHDLGSVIDEIAAWLHAERQKKKARENRRQVKQKDNSSLRILNESDGLSASPSSFQHEDRRASNESDSSLDLDQLEGIISKGISQSNRSTTSFQRYPSSTRLSSKQRPSIQRQGSTYKPPYTDTQNEEVFVPSCEEILDNSKISSSAYEIATPKVTPLIGMARSKDRLTNPWTPFKEDILRLTHTLKLRGWRRISFDKSDEIDVQRLSGALTNAVYVVSPPLDLVSVPSIRKAGETDVAPRKPPMKLLLRIYGPNVDYLIDRDSELSILRRLAKKNIGPRLLGTFINGRFEEYLHATTLKPQDLRDPRTSQQIAKRMRELHDGIELLEEEREAGPFIWQNWDKWLDRAEQNALCLDKVVRIQHSNTPSVVKSIKKNGLVCGTDWSTFRKVVERYREELQKHYGGLQKLKNQLVFAHNDAQYGNILRVDPPSESPLLLPANHHKQLVVIDFEYANANVAGFEFANHFTEWCYNYHDEEKPHLCNTSHYPTREEQYRFIHAYLKHQPEHTPAAANTPRLGPTDSFSSSSSRSLDSHRSIMPESDEDFPSFGRSLTTDSEKEASLRSEIRTLMHEARIWRMANSAQWVVWGILQTKTPEIMSVDEVFESRESGASGLADSSGQSSSNDDNVSCSRDKHTDEIGTNYSAENDFEPEDSSEFDYLSYARDRAMFFWGDALQLGFVTKDELGEELMKDVKIVEY